MINLSKRLKTVSKYVSNHSKIIDIGCDHALLDIYLYETLEDVKIIISDINKNALESGINNLKKYHLEDKIEARLGSGLKVVDKDEINTIIISGMGAHSIVGILLYDKDKLKNVNTLIIQSNNDLDFLRKKIIKLGYYIENEELVKDKNIIYTVIKFKKGKKRYSKKELYFGPILLKENNLLFKEKNKDDLSKLQSIYKLVPKNKYLYRYKLKSKISYYK